MVVHRRRLTIVPTRWAIAEARSQQGGRRVPASNTDQGGCANAVVV